MGFVALLLLFVSLATPSLSAPNAFAANHRVNDDLGTALQQRAVAVADSFGRVYATWEDVRNGDFDIYFAKSADGGKTFGPGVRLGGDRAVGTSQERPAMALGPKGEVVVIWQDDRLTYMDYDIFGTVSYDRGSTFVSPVRVDDGAGGIIQRFPSLAVDATGAVYAAWQESHNGNGDVRLARGALSPFLFGRSVRADDDVANAGTQSSPSVAAGSLGDVYVAYHDNRTGNANVYLAKSTDGGASFGPSVRVDDTGTSATAQGLVSLAIDSLDNLFAVWQDERRGGGDFDVYFAKSTDGGRSFSPNVRVDDGIRGTSQGAPRITVGAAGTLYVTWQDERNTDTDIYASLSVDGGATFGSGIRVDDAGDSTSDPAVQYSPQIVESNTGLIAVLWQDGRKDDGDIYATTALFPVGSALEAEISLRPTWIAPGEKTNITVRVTSNGTEVDGAAVYLTANASGSFGPVVPLGAGYYGSTFTPLLAMNASGGVASVAITATASKSGYATGAGRAPLKVSPRILVSIQAPWDTLAVGQSMEVKAYATSGGIPMAGAAVLATTSAGGSLGATSGTTDSAGLWKTTFAPLSSAGGTTVTATVDVSRSGFIPGSAVIAIAVLAEPRPLEMQLDSNRHEMMSYETATITVWLQSGGLGVPRAQITATSRGAGGNFTPAMDQGDGRYTFTYDAPKVTSQTWVLLSVNAKVGGYSDARGRLYITVDPNKTNPPNPTQLYLFCAPSATTLRSGQTTTVTVYVYTVEGYAVSGATVVASLRFPTQGTVSASTDTLNGVYTFRYTAATFTTSTLVTISIKAEKYGYAAAVTRTSISVVP